MKDIYIYKDTFYLNGQFNLLENVQRLDATQIETFADNARMQTFGQIDVGLFQQLTDQQNGRGGSIASHVILGSAGSGDQRSSRMLDLHFVQENVAVLGDLDVTGSRDQPEIE